MRWRLLLTFLLCAPLSIEASAQEAKIGFVGPFTGPSANSGIAMRAGAQLAIDEVNEKGGLQLANKRLRVKGFFEDSQSRPEVGVAAAQRLLTRDEVDVLVGDIFHSHVVLAIMELAGTFDKFMMSGQPISTEIEKKIKADPQKYRNFWKPGYSSEGYAETIFGTVQGMIDAGTLKPKNKTVTFLIDDSDSGRANANNARAVFEKAGWTFGGTEVVPSGHSDFYPQLSKLRRSEPDVLVTSFTAPNSGAALVRQIKETGLSSLHFALFFPTRPEFYQQAGKAAEGLVWAPLFFDPDHNKTHKAFAERIKALTPSPANADHALGYCTTAMLLDNISKAKTLEPAKISEEFAKTDFPCIIGRWRFKTDGTHAAITGPDGIPMPAAQIQNGESFAIWPPAAATSKYKPAAN